MKNKIYLVFFVTVLIFIVGCSPKQDEQINTPTGNDIYSPEAIEEPIEENTPSSQVPAPDNEDVEELIVEDDNIENVEIEIEDFKYNPSTITISKGTTIVWKQRDSTKHTVTSDNNLFDSGLLSKDETWSYTFNEAGVFEYHCKPHTYMKGKIIVE